MEPTKRNYEWLMENGSPAIRMRTHKAIIGESPTPQMIDDLLDFPMTREWMTRLHPGFHLNALHGSKPECLENIGGKLHELGLDASMSPDWTNSLAVYIEHLKSFDRQQVQYEFTPLYIFAPLAIIGCTHPVILDLAVNHLKRIGDFCRQMDFNIFIDPETFGGMYAAYKDRKLIDPKNNHLLPTIWDLYLLAFMPRTHHPEVIDSAENAILNYILTDEYQSFPQGYGIMYHEPNKKYYSHGWNIDLPGWFDTAPNQSRHSSYFLQRVELMANFKLAHKDKWFQQGVEYLDSFKTNNGTYRFPSAYLKEGSSGYYVYGNYLRLEVNRRRKIALDLDSTFRMELIKKRIFQA